MTLYSRLNTLLKLVKHKILFFVQRKKAIRFKKARDLAGSVLRYQLQFRIGRVMPLGNDKALDLAVRGAMAELMFPTQSVSAEYADVFKKFNDPSTKKQIAELVNGALDDPDLKSTIIEALQFQYLIYKTLRRKEDSEEMAALIEHFGGTLPEETDKFVKSETLRLKARLRQLADRARDASTFKMDLSLSGIGGVLSVISALFAVSGYVYNTYVYNAIGIDVSLYFSLSDYLAASVEKIRYAGWSTALCLFVIYFQFNHYSRNPSAMLDGREAAFMSAYRYAVLAVFILIAILNYLEGGLAYVNVTAGISVIMGLFLAVRVSSVYFSRPLHAMFSLMFLLTFSISLARSAVMDVLSLQRGSYSLHQNVRIIPSRDLRFDLTKAILVGGNSTYLFFYNANTREGMIIPKSDIREFVVTNPEAK